VLGLLAAPVAAHAFQAELARYQRVVSGICHTGITPAIVAAYEQARRAVERAGHGGGRDGNFWGVRTPESFWLDCFQSGGEGRE
jgi:hypothetical protein